ncbi:aspartyl protease family protein At5g10770-like [Dendrobium catenatum]|uniref:aspartyl protease family protein At5g10770-like n=1 Tax=Dendrobium catenatum TaxID=906689 RepID=UPI0010A07EBE|nr:aspartyl protease family protein At5g10770-like [Dendrobium catenatum]
MCPCNNCYPQNDLLYDPTQSSTFSKISCQSSYCHQLDVYYCPSPSSCIYIEYVDDSHTQGSLIQDALTFSSDTMQNICFDCSHDNGGQFMKIDGLLGLGRGALLIISQTAQFYGKLVAISIGGERLALSLTVFSAAGTMLDSGTVISRLPPTAYSALRSIFRQHMTNYPIAPSLSILDTCYDFTNYQKVKVPAIAFIFDGGVTANLDFRGYFIWPKNLKRV